MQIAWENSQHFTTQPLVSNEANSLRKQPTLYHAATGFLACGHRCISSCRFCPLENTPVSAGYWFPREIKWCLSNEPKNSILIFQPLKTSWVILLPRAHYTPCQWLSATRLFPRHFTRKPVVASWNVSCFLIGFLPGWFRLVWSISVHPGLSLDKLSSHFACPGPLLACLMTCMEPCPLGKWGLIFTCPTR